MSMIQVPEWGIGSDNIIEIFLPETYDANYRNIICVIRCQNCPSRIEASYSVLVLDGYISDGVEVFYDEADPETGELKDGVRIQIRRAQSAGFIAGVKYAEILSNRIDTDFPVNERHLIGRQYFASYYENKL